MQLHPCSDFFLQPVQLNLPRLLIYSWSGTWTVATKGSVSSVRVLCCGTPQEGVYFRNFLDPDQGQTGPVSWEVAPLPPPRPVLTFKPVFTCLYWRYRPNNEAGPATARSTESP